MFVTINGTDRSEFVIKDSIQIREEMQERVNACDISFVDNTYISYFNDVQVHDGCLVVSLVGAVLTVDKDFTYNGLFRAGTVLVLGINETTQEEVTVLTQVGKTITLAATPASAHAAGQKVGVLKFAGTINDIQNSNIGSLKNLQWDVTCLDYTKIFDKRLINDTYASKDARYIVNDFCNVSVNKNECIDQMDYADNATIQAEWIESGDGANPTVSTTDPYESTGWGRMNWTFSGGTATFAATPTTVNLRPFAGVASGTPTKGYLGFWYRCADYTKVTNFKVRIGSDSSNYLEFTVVPTSNTATFADLPFTGAAKTGTPVWTATDYIAVVVNETATSSIDFAGFRVLENQHFKHYPHVKASTVFDNFNIARVKPTEVMQRIADELDWYWDIDYKRNILLFPQDTTLAPFNLDATSNNFDNLSITYDTSRLLNKQVVKGGEETSTSMYTQVEQGDGIGKEWLMKSKFKNLVVLLDKNTSTDLCEAGTNTTNIKATAHGLVTDDYIVNRTRSNAVRKITKVDNDNFTVATVASQTTGDTFSKFTSQAIGIEGLDSEAGKNFMYNYTEKSIRNSLTEAVLLTGEFIQFRYNEVVPILAQRTDNASVTAMMTVLGYTDGVFEGQPILDATIKTRSEALGVAGAMIRKYANMVLTATFTTDQEGLRPGQYINITDTSSSNRHIDQSFLILQTTQSQAADGLNTYQVTASSLLYGVFELLQQILKQGRKISVAEDAIVENVNDIYETIDVSDSASSTKTGELQTETQTITDSVTSISFTPPYYYEPTGLSDSRYDLASYS